MFNKIIGIMGGMGTEATIDLFHKIFIAVKTEGAPTDQDHPEIVISNIPSTPDRSRAIQGTGPSPEPDLLRSARRLEQAGADFIAMPCVTAHHYLTVIQAAIKIPVLDMVALSVTYIRKRYPDLDNVGILATDGTIVAGLWQRELVKAGLHPLQPDVEHQKLVMDTIYAADGIKSGNRGQANAAKLSRVSRLLESMGAHVLVAGCTEVPLVIDLLDVGVPLVDPTAVLADAAVEAARAR